MVGNYKVAAQNAVQALQQWYGADPYASTTGLYHWDDPNIVADIGGDATVANVESILLKAYGYADAFQDTMRWWNAANTITALIDYMLITNDRQYLSVVDNTFNKGPSAFTISVNGVEVGAISGAEEGAAAGAAAGFLLGGPLGGIVGGVVGAVVGFFEGGGHAAATTARIYKTNFLNQFNDDMGWWALAWIKAYDLTGDEKYLAQAQTIFNSISAVPGGWDGVCSGGIYWQKNQQGPDGKTPYKNSIANELFLVVAASLYVRHAATPAGANYLTQANQEWNWFYNSGLINVNNMINDSFGATSTGWTCTNDQSTAVWTYNQGVILGGLCELFTASQQVPVSSAQKQLLDEAVKIADALTTTQFVYRNAQQSQIGNNATASMPFIMAYPSEDWFHSDDWVYFRGTDDGLWRVNYDGSQQSQIGNNKTASTPFVTSHGGEDWVYFQGTDNKLWRVKYDGSQQSQIGNNTTAAMPFVTVQGNDDWVYFQGTDNKLRRVKYDGSQQSQIGNNTTASTPFVISHGSDDWVYFRGTDNKLWRVKFDGSEQSQIGDNTTASMPFVMPHGSDDWVYFRGTDNRLWRVKFDGSEQSQIGNNTTSSSPHVMSVSGIDWVYFQGTDNRLWQVRYDGSQQSQIANNTTASSPFVAADGWLYFQGTDDKLWRVFVGSAAGSVSGINRSGILTEHNDSDPYTGVDNKQFKGIFMRNLGYLYKLRPLARYRAFILNNANSVLNNDMNGSSQFGGNWSGPFDSADFVRQTAAIDLLNAANVIPPQMNYTSLKQFLTDSGVSLSAGVRTVLNGAGSLASVMHI
jgi:predicted alpha-1,6-mannanase (GH76 family)